MVNNKKILIWVLFILWAVFLCFANYLPKNYFSNLQGITGFIMAFFYIVPFLLFFCWIGLPFSYLLKKLLDKAYIYLCPKKIRKEIAVARYITYGIGHVYLRLFFLLGIPLGIGVAIACYSPLDQIINWLISFKLLFLLFQLAGLYYIYLLFFLKLDKYFGLETKEAKPKEVRQFLKKVSPTQLYAVGVFCYLVGILWIVYYFYSSSLSSLVHASLFFIAGTSLVLYGKFSKKKKQSAKLTKIKRG